MIHKLNASVNIAIFLENSYVNDGDEIELNGNETYFIHNKPISKQVTITGYNATINVENGWCPSMSNIHFNNVTFIGRLNIDDHNEVKPKNLKFEHCFFFSSPKSADASECVKLTRGHDIIFTECLFERSSSGGANDRLLAIVGGSNIQVLNCNFINGNHGAIQIKGGAKDVVFARNFVNKCGQRAIQIGGQTCDTCWGKGVEPGPYEAESCIVRENIVINNATPIVISTQAHSVVRNNTFYTPQEYGGMFLFRLLQEEIEDTFDRIKPNTGLKMLHNLFLYPAKTIDGRAGINGNVVNWNSGQDFESFLFSNNSFYCITPHQNWGYPHDHVVTNFPKYVPFDWKVNFYNQVNPLILDWGFPTMRPIAATHANVGCHVKVGTPYFRYGSLPQPPHGKFTYTQPTTPATWEGPGSYIKEPNDLTKEKALEDILKLITVEFDSLYEYMKDIKERGNSLKETYEK